MLIEIDDSCQVINTKRVESIFLNPDKDNFIVTLFSGKVIYVKLEIVEKILNLSNG